MFNQVIFQKLDSKIFSRFAEYFRDESKRIVLLFFCLL